MPVRTAPALPSPAISDPASTGAPAVVAVVVTHDPGEWFETALSSLGAQDYPNFAVLVVDAQSAEDPSGRVAAVQPDAYVHRLDSNDGFGVAANTALEIVEGAAFYLFCHDDVALEPGALRVLVEEAFRSNAGVVGPKLVTWEDQRRLLAVGESVDKSGYRAPLVERYELDQEQHDAVRDVFVIPGAATLVRADLFAGIGGFDEAVSFHNDDLALCWRAHLAGARVVVTPEAVARHVEALGDRHPVQERRRFQNRHRVRTLLCCYSAFHLVRVVPQVLLITVVEALYALVVGRTRQARDVTGAWVHNLRRLDGIRQERRRIAAYRRVPDSEIRNLQVRGSARFSAFLRGQLGADEDRLRRATAAGRGLASTMRTGSASTALAAWVVVLLLLGFGSRHLLTTSVPAIGDLAAFEEGALDSIRHWISGWRTVGLGSDSPNPTALGATGLLGLGFLGSMGLLRQVLILGLLPLGAIGAYRFWSPVGSRRAQAASLVAYVALPVPYDALADARWDVLVLWAAAPFLLAQLGRAGGVAPFAGGRDRSRAGPATFRRHLAALGVILALVGVIAPSVVVVMVVLTAALLVGQLLTGRAGPMGRLAAAGVGAVVLAAVLQVPWTFEFAAPGARWSALVGADRGPAGLAVTELLAFDTSGEGSPLVYGVLLAAGLPLLIGRRWRLDWAVRGWAVALACVAAVWAAEQDWSPVALPPAGMFLAVAAAGLALSAGLGVIAFEEDLRAYAFGWRQLAAAAAGVALLVASVPLLGRAVDGRWSMPGGELEQVLSFLDEQVEEVPFRTLWIGDPEVLPLGAYGLDEGVGYATTDHGTPGLADRYPGGAERPTELLADALELAGARETSRLGRILAPMAVRYVVVVEQLAPASFTEEIHPVPEEVDALLGAQLDLQAIEVDPSVTVYANEAFLPLQSRVPEGFGEPDDRYTDLATVVAVPGDAVLTDRAGHATYEGELEGGSRVLQSSAASERWRLEVGGAAADREDAFGFVNAYDVESSGEATLSYRTPVLRYLALALQVVLWLVALRALLRYRLGPPEARA